MDRQEFINCVERTQKSLRRFLVSLCGGDIVVADDIAQEAYMKAYIASHGFHNKDKFKAWITKIAYNVFLTQVKGKRIKLPIEEIRDLESEETTESGFLYENLYQALNSLPLKERSALVFYYLEGYGTKEISGLLGISEEAVRQNLSRGRKRLKNLIE